MYFKIILLAFLIYGWTNLAIFVLFFNVVITVFGKRIFAGSCTKFGDEYNVISDAFKRELFKDLNDMNPGEKISILEIGGASGMNFKYWDRKATVQIVEPNPHFEENRAKFPKLDIRDIKQGFGEDLATAGISSGSVDCVVMTLVLCSVQDQEKCLQEVLRVLKPGGKFFYMEHVAAAEDASTARLLQKAEGRRRLLQKAVMLGGFWPFVADGCCTDRDTGEVVAQASFKAVNQKKFNLTMPEDAKIVFKICGFILQSHLTGVATK